MSALNKILLVNSGKPLPTHIIFSIVQVLDVLKNLKMIVKKNPVSAS